MMRQWFAGATVGAVLVLGLTALGVGQTGANFGSLSPFFTGNIYRRGNPNQPTDEVFLKFVRLGYVAGARDAWTLQAYAKNELQVDTAERFSRCIQRLGPGFTLEQAVAIVDRYLQANPDKWNWPMSMLVDLAFADACH